jgi:asparagine synthase (glutamine-hydrolysing)
MSRALGHRGPDGSGVRECGPVTLVHTRLSIIDLAAGHQPMSEETENVWIVFNGEIFNYLELRSELSGRGYVFRTRSDTETIIHAYQEWGDAFLDRLNGQFAIALWDRRRQRLLLARDRVGIRPLFFREEAGVLYFASEIKALRAALPEASWKLDIRGLGQALLFWGAVGDRTSFENVRSLPPGHALVLENGCASMRRYWGWEFPARGGLRQIGLAQAADELRSLLQDAVQLQLRADVPVGAYLSGGLDSSGLVALIRQRSGVRLRTFSVSFGDSEFDESPQQLEMARFLRTEHASVHCGRNRIAEIFPLLIAHTETTILRTAPAPLMMLSRLVRESGFKVVLTGEGADEVFGGYDLFKEAAIKRFWARQPDSKWRPELFSRLYPYLRNSPASNRAFSRAFFGQGLTETSNPFYGHATRWATSRRSWAFLSKDARQALSGWRPEDDLLRLMPASMQGWEGVARDQYVEATTLLYGYLLSSQGDRVAMANSVEGRVPYLDHRVIEFANALPARLKLRGLREKAVLREALRPLLPPSIVNRAKQPYRAPDSVSFFMEGDAPEYVKYQFSAGRMKEAGIFDPVMAERLYEKCRAGKALGFADNMAFVGILSTMLLEDQFVQGRPAE